MSIDILICAHVSFSVTSLFKINSKKPMLFLKKKEECKSSVAESSMVTKNHYVNFINDVLGKMNELTKMKGYCLIMDNAFIHSGKDNW